MELFKTNKIKSLLLGGVLSLSLFFGGCSSSTTTLSTLTDFNTTQDKNDNYSTPSVPKAWVEASIERVVDGDTIKVKLKDSGKTVTLRLLLIDTPESVKPGVDPQLYSIDASNFAKELLKIGDKTYIEYDEGDKTDKYDRHLCYLWFYNKEDKSWKMFNEKIVEEGLARVGYVYSQRRHLDTLYKAEDKAKASKLNIWSVNGYVTDKGFDVDTYNNEGTILSNSSSSDNKSESNLNEIVYANGGNSSSNKYHSFEHAHGMKGAIKMTKSQAKSKGYKACGLCY
ncbi:thermonuclease family protein [Terrisporobacter glycolicus]|nr:thermonuclease family protein [Terrisporobacter glycolicus]